MTVRLTVGDDKHTTGINSGSYFTATEMVIELNVYSILIIKQIYTFFLQQLRLSASKTKLS